MSTDFCQAAGGVEFYKIYKITQEVVNFYTFSKIV